MVYITPHESVQSSWSAIRGLDHLTTLKNSVSSRGYESDINWEKGEGHPFEYFVYGAACSEVEIDCLTGDHKVSTSWKGLQVALRMHLNSTDAIYLRRAE